MSNRVGILLSAISGFNEDRLQLGIGTTISRIYSPLLVTIETGSFIWHIVQVPLETLAKIVLCPFKCCPGAMGRTIKRWNNTLNPLDTVAKVIKLFLGIISSLLLAWSIPTWNVSLHWHIDRHLPGNSIFGEQLAEHEKNKTNLLITAAVNPLNKQIEELTRSNKTLDERNKVLADTNKDLERTMNEQGQTILAQGEELAKLRPGEDPLRALATTNPEEAAKQFVAEVEAEKGAGVADSSSSSSSS